MTPSSQKHSGDRRAIRIAIVFSAYNRWITEPMVRGAEEALARAASSGGFSAVPELFEAPGAFELPVLAGAAARTGRFDAVVCIGCIIKGETKHDEVIGIAVANAIQSVACGAGVPIGFGVLTVDTPEQAEARAGGAMGNKGAEAMDAALAALRAIRSMAEARGVSAGR